jgi:microcystin-dependent protein
MLGTIFGGDGVNNFAVPDMRKLAPNNMTYSICVSGVFP